MTNPKDGGPTYPRINGIVDHPHGGGKDIFTDPGKTLRDWFAGQALVGLLQNWPESDCGPDGYAKDAYAQADAMITERERRDGGTE